MGQAHLFSRIENGGLGIEEPSTIIAVECISGLHKAINLDTDNTLRYSTEHRLNALRRYYSNCFHPTSREFKPEQEIEALKSHVWSAVKLMKKVNIDMVNLDNSHNLINKKLLIDFMNISQGGGYAKEIQTLVNGEIHTIDQLGKPKNAKEWAKFKKNFTFPKINNDDMVRLHKYVIRNINKVKPITKQHYEKPIRYKIAFPANNKEVVFYTDGGFDPDRNIATFAAVNAENKEYRIGGKLPGYQNSYTAELHGVLAALHNVRDDQSATIYLDCQSAIDAVEGYNGNNKLEIRTKYKYKNILETIRIETNRISGLQLKHIKGHIGLEGNTEAGMY